MKTFFKILIVISLSALIFFLHLIVSDIFPAPLNRINVFFLALFWFMALNTGARLAWVALPTMFLFEIFSSVPFGVSSLALLACLWSVNWFLTNIFTNGSIIIIFISCFLGMIIYRILFAIILDVLAFTNHEIFYSGNDTFLNMITEITLTSCAAFLFYLFTYLFLRRLSPKYIKDGGGLAS